MVSGRWALDWLQIVFFSLFFYRIKISVNWSDYIYKWKHIKNYFIAPTVLIYILHISLFLLQNYPGPLTTESYIKGDRREPGREFLEQRNKWQQEAGCGCFQTSQSCLSLANQPQLLVSSKKSNWCAQSRSLSHTSPRDLLWPGAFPPPTRPPCAEGQRGSPAPVPTRTLAVVATPPWGWQAKVFWGWKEPVWAVLLRSRDRVARCPDRQLPLYHTGWSAFVCRSQQRGEERSPHIPGLASKALCNLTPPTYPGKSHTCLITLTFLCPLAPLGLHSPLPRGSLCTYFSCRTQHKSYLLRVPVAAQRKRAQLVSMKMQVRSLAPLTGLWILCCCELWCRLQMQLGSGIAVALA